MFAFILRRLLFAVPIIIGSSLLVFSIFYLSRVDPVQRALGERAQDAELVKRLRDELGLNDPAWQRYLRFIGGVAVGDFGKSIKTRQPVADEIRARFPATVELAGAAFILSTVFGLCAGVLAGLRRNTVWDYTSMALAMIAVSLPVFWLALLLSWTFGEWLGWLPIDQRHSLRYAGAVPTRSGLLLLDSVVAGRWDVFLDALRHLVLPATTLALVSTALVARMTRSSILEVLRADFVRTASAKGLGGGRWLWHVVRNAMIPVVTILGLEIPSLLGGAVITETIFAWPGMGSFLIDSILSADVTAVQGIILFLTLIFVATNLAVDVLYALLDPRLRALAEG